MRSQTSNMKHLTFNNLVLISFFIIFGVLFFSPVYAEDFNLESGSDEGIIIEKININIEMDNDKDGEGTAIVEIIDEDQEEEYKIEEESEDFAFNLESGEDTEIESLIFTPEIEDESEDDEIDVLLLTTTEEVGTTDSTSRTTPTLEVEIEDSDPAITILITPTTIEPIAELSTITIHLQIEAYDATLFNDDFVVTECLPTEESSTTTFTTYCALQQLSEDQNWNTNFNFSGDSVFLSSINNYNGADWNWWAFFHNLDFASEALNEYVLQENDSIILSYGTFPLKIEAATTTPELDTTTTVKIKEFGFDLSWNSAWLDSPSSTFVINREEIFDEDGIYELDITTTTPYEIYGTKDNFVNSSILTVSPQELVEETILTTTTIHFQFETNDGTVFNNDSYVVESCDYDGQSTLTTWCAIQQIANEESWELGYTDYGGEWGIFLSTVTTSLGTYNYPSFFVNNDLGPGISSYDLQENDHILFTVNINPLKIEIETQTPELNTTTTINIKEFGFDAFWNSVWSDSTSSTIIINNEEYFDEDGIFELEITTTTPYEIYGKKDGYLDSEVLIISPTSTAENIADENDDNIGGGPSTITHNNLDVEKAIKFLSNNENDGILGSSAIYTDWAAIAFGAYNKNHQTAQNIKDYLLTDPNSLAGLNDVSDYARRAMALMSLGINPYSGTNTNYIDSLVNQFDGTQFGDVNLFNDDIFAIIPLLNAGYNSQDEIISKTVEFILSKQINGGWGSIDMTAAAIQTLSPLTEISGVSEALVSAKNKLKDAQDTSGGWNNTPATAWTMQSIISLNENIEDWKTSNKTPGDYLYSIQISDGGVDKDADENTRIWNTSYAIPAALGMNWHNILQNFNKPVILPVNPDPGPTGFATTTDSIITTSTPTTALDIVETPTTTIKIASPTPDLIEEPAPTPKSQITPASTPTYTPPTVKTPEHDDSSTTTKHTTTTPDPTLTPHTGQTLSANTSSTPLQSAAKGVFGTATAMASGLGLYLGWRFLLTLV